MENYGIIYTAYFFIYIGELSERFKVRLSKSRVLKSTVGSNPMLSV